MKTIYFVKNHGSDNIAKQGSESFFQKLTLTVMTKPPEPIPDFRIKTIHGGEREK